MIDIKEVVNLKMPFPNIDSGLARRYHMYICMDKNKDVLFVKSQTNKPTILNHVKNYLIEKADINRNPFTRPTLIDLDKEFHISRSIQISRASLCRIRNDVSDDLFSDIQNKIDNPTPRHFDVNELVELNPEYLSKVDL